MHLHMPHGCIVHFPKWGLGGNPSLCLRLAASIVQVTFLTWTHLEVGGSVPPSDGAIANSGDRQRRMEDAPLEESLRDGHAHHKLDKFIA